MGMVTAMAYKIRVHLGYVAVAYRIFCAPQNTIPPIAIFLVVSAASVGRPIGNKKEKAERNAVASLASVQAWIDMCLTEVSLDSSLREQNFNDGWKTLFDKQDKKNKIEREEVEAAKIEAQTTMIKAGVTRIKG
jgi:hypothetical protein